MRLRTRGVSGLVRGFAIGALLLTGPWPAAADELTDNLSAVQSAITEAEAESVRYESGLIRTQIELRLQTLRATEAMLEQRALADKSGATFTYSLAGVAPDERREAELLEDLVAARQQLLNLEADASKYSGGLVQAMALVAVATQQQTIALLEQGYLAAHYGLAYHVPSSPALTETGETQPSATPSAPAADSREELQARVARTAEAFVSEGVTAEAVGFFIITQSKSDLDDSAIVNAIISPRSLSGFDEDTSLMFGCHEGEPRFLIYGGYYIGDDYSIDVTYRIGDYPAIDTQWSMSSNNRAIGHFGSSAVDFTRKLVGEDKFFVQITERLGERSRHTFELIGIDDAFKKVSKACGWTGLLATPEEREAAQKALKVLGLYDGAIDGAWGPGSRSAMVEYQKSQGLEPSGLIDDETKQSLGF